jgi:hypothetical protein
MRSSTKMGLLALVGTVLLAWPVYSLATGGAGGGNPDHPNRGNHCGRGHPKHTHAVGRSCEKLARRSAAHQAVTHKGDRPDRSSADERSDENATDETTTAPIDETTPQDVGEIDEPGDVADDQGEDVDDQGEDVDNNQDEDVDDQGEDADDQDEDVDDQGEDAGNQDEHNQGTDDADD